MEKQHENMIIMGTIFGKRKKEPFVYWNTQCMDFLTIFLSIMTNSYRKGVD